MVVASSCCGDVFQRQGLGDRIEGKMNGANYKEILNENLPRSSDWGEGSPSNRTMTLSTQPRQHSQIEHPWKDLKMAV
jgi:hypothetical protein